MIYLILSITFSTLILVVFKWFERFKINTFQAIVSNYFVAFTVGFLLYGSEWQSQSLAETEWIPFALIIGFLFITLFLMMGKSAQINGIGTTSVAVKMSLAIPVVAAIFLYNESVYLFKVMGIVGALISVYLITKDKEKSKNSSIDTKKATPILLIILFLGSGILDTLLNYAEKNVMTLITPALFSAVGFGIAAIFGSLFLVYKLISGKEKLSLKSLFAGIVLGIPNYFSIFFLIMAIRQPMEDSITYAINNVGIVVCSFLVGVLFFKEKVTPLKLFGGILALVAILLLSV